MFQRRQWLPLVGQLESCVMSNMPPATCSTSIQNSLSVIAPLASRDCSLASTRLTNMASMGVSTLLIYMFPCN